MKKEVPFGDLTVGSNYLVKFYGSIEAIDEIHILESTKECVNIKVYTPHKTDNYYELWKLKTDLITLVIEELID